MSDCEKDLIYSRNYIENCITIRHDNKVHIKARHEDKYRSWYWALSERGSFESLSTKKIIRLKTSKVLIEMNDCKQNRWETI